MKTILVVEDDKIILTGLRQALEHEGYCVRCAVNGAEGLYMAQTERPDLVILDIMMPEMNGFEVMTEIRRRGQQTPIIVLSARVDCKDKVRGLELGADDYVSKPFDLDELLARIKRHMQRHHTKTQYFSEYCYDWILRQLTFNEKPVRLKSKERLMLECFLKRPNQIITREQLLDYVWGEDYDGTDRTIDNIIVSLRKKIEASHVLTERGLGYRFVTNP